MTTIGVVVTNYNHGAYLREAVDSVLAQSRQPERIIVIDDGSTDHSSDVLDKLPSHVEVVRQDNQGVVSARNRGLDMLDTTHVAFLDADDLLLPGFLRWTSAAWSIPHSNRMALVYAPCRNINAAGAHGYLHSRAWNPAELRRQNYIANVALCSRSALIQVGGYSDTFNRIGHEDWDLLLRLAEHGWTGRLIPAPLWCYRQLPEGRNAISVEQHKAEVDAAIAALHPAEHFIAPPVWRRLAAKPLNVAQTILRNRDALTWLSSPPSL